MQINSSFAEADVGNVIPGQKINFTVDTFPDRNFSGVVKQTRLTPTIQQNIVTYDVVVNVKNQDEILLPGMTAYLTIETAKHTNVLLVPNAALRIKPKVGAAQNIAKTNTAAVQAPSSPAEKRGTVYKLVGNEL